MVYAAWLREPLNLVAICRTEHLNLTNFTVKNFTFAPELKQVLAISFVLLLFLQPLSKIWIYVSFKINQDYIAKNLCINRDKPAMHCNGKCQLIKKLNEADKDEQKQFPQTLNEKSDVLYCNNLADSLLPQPLYNSHKKQSICFNKFLYKFSFNSDIFLPPKFILI